MAPIGSTGECLPCGCIIFTGKEIPENIESFDLDIVELREHKVKQIKDAFFRTHLYAVAYTDMVDFILAYSSGKDLSALEAFISTHTKTISEIVAQINAIEKASTIEEIISITV